MRHPIAIQLAALVLACGCGSGDIDGPPFSPLGGAGGAGTTGAGGNAGNAGDASAGETGELLPGADPPLFTDEPAAPTAEAEGCDKVDFLYVVDNSASMVDKQENLARSFQGFSRIVTETLGTNDHHIMVIDTDAVNAGDLLAGGGSASGDECGRTLGSGRRNGGEGEECGIEGAQRYMLDDQENLASTFSCLAKVGIYGNIGEQPVDALLTATGAIRADIEGCNEGFVRDDAVLVVTVITDEEDAESRGDPSFWKRMLLNVKGGNEEAIVMLGLIADNHITGGLPGGPCDEFSGSPAPRLERFVRSFGLGAIGSVCAPDYSTFFAEAVSSIGTACDRFVPPR